MILQRNDWSKMGGWSRMNGSRKKEKLVVNCEKTKRVGGVLDRREDRDEITFN